MKVVFGKIFFRLERREGEHWQNTTIGTMVLNAFVEHQPLLAGRKGVTF